VAWRDNALMYAGSLSWDGRASASLLAVEVVDGKTRRSLGPRQVPAYGHADPAGSNQWVVSSQIAVAGDSQNGTPHSHSINLYFEPRGGGWILVRNCTAPGDCYEASR
jgi:hypothetical protein